MKDSVCNHEKLACHFFLFFIMMQPKNPAECHHIFSNESKLAELQMCPMPARESSGSPSPLQASLQSNSPDCWFSQLSRQRLVEDSGGTRAPVSVSAGKRQGARPITASVLNELIGLVYYKPWKSLRYQMLFMLFFFFFCQSAWIIDRLSGRSDHLDKYHKKEKHLIFSFWALIRDVTDGIKNTGMKL